MKHQNPASSVSRSFFSFLLISRQSLVSVAGCLSSVWMAVARFSGGIRSNPFEEDSARNGLPPDLAAATQATRYLCIRASGTSGWRDEPQLYHRLLPLPQEKNNVTGLPFLVAQISFITNRLNRILSLLHILNATAITISRL